MILRFYYIGFSKKLVPLHQTSVTAATHKCKHKHLGYNRVSTPILTPRSDELVHCDCCQKLNTLSKEKSKHAYFTHDKTCILQPNFKANGSNLNLFQPFLCVFCSSYPQLRIYKVQQRHCHYNIGFAQIFRKMLPHLNETVIRFIRKSLLCFAVVTIFLTNLHAGGLKKG